MNTDENHYQFWQEKQLQRWESLCTQCGACCGAAEGDPCEYLEKLDNGRYWCTIYDNRFGAHKTRGGKPFLCVPVRDILHNPWPGDSFCGYKKYSFRKFDDPDNRLSGSPSHGSPNTRIT